MVYLFVKNTLFHAADQWKYPFLVSFLSASCFPPPLFRRLIFSHAWRDFAHLKGGKRKGKHKKTNRSPSRPTGLKRNSLICGAETAWKDGTLGVISLGLEIWEREKRNRKFILNHKTKERKKNALGNRSTKIIYGTLLSSEIRRNKHRVKIRGKQLSLRKIGKSYSCDFTSSFFFVPSPLVFSLLFLCKKAPGLLLGQKRRNLIGTAHKFLHFCSFFACAKMFEREITTILPQHHRGKK